MPPWPERCNTSSTPSGLSHWGTLTGFILGQRGRASSGRYKNRLGPAEFAFGRRRLLFGGWDDRIHCELSPPPRLLLRKRLPPLSVQRLTTEPSGRAAYL